MMKLGYRIYMLMKNRGLTQIQLAERSGLSKQIISHYINNRSKPGYDAVLALSKALEVSPLWFFDEAVPSGDIIVFGKVQRGGTLKIGHLLPIDNIPSPVSLDRKTTGIVLNLYRLMFSTLLQKYALSGPKGGIAYNWKQGGNYWIFDLFSNVTFHNGHLCTAADVEYSYQKWMSLDKNNPIVTAQAIDTHTFLLELKKECTLFDIPMPFIVPKGGGSGIYQFVGTGPFKALDIQPDFFRLQAHKGYHRGGPFVDEVTVRRYQNPTELEQALLLEQVNFAVGIDVRDERFNVQTEPLAQRYELMFRFSSPLCRDVRFRKAIYLGLDRAAIAKAAGLRKPKFAKGAFDYVLSECSKVPEAPDRQKAKQLLSEIKNINEMRLSFEFSYVDAKRERIVSEIIAQLSALGIQAEIVKRKVDKSRFIGADAVVVLLNTRTPYLERQIWKKNGTAEYISGYHNPSVEKLLDNLTNISTDAEALESMAPKSELLRGGRTLLSFCKPIQSLILGDYPSVPLFYNEIPITYVKNLRALEDRMILMTMLNDIHTWYFESKVDLIPFPTRIKPERETETSLPGVV